MRACGELSSLTIGSRRDDPQRSTANFLAMELYLVPLLQLRSGQEMSAKGEDIILCIRDIHGLTNVSTESDG